MTARDTFNTSVATANGSKAATVAAAHAVFLTTIDASKSIVGYTLQSGNFANLQTATANANKAKLDAIFNAEAVRQAAVATARDTLRSTGDVGPV